MMIKRNGTNLGSQIVDVGRVRTLRACRTGSMAVFKFPDDVAGCDLEVCDCYGWNCVILSQSIRSSSNPQ